MTSGTLMEILQFIILEYLSLTTHYNFTSLTCWNKVRLYFNFNFLRVHRRENKFCSHEVSMRLDLKTTQYFDGYV